MVNYKVVIPARYQSTRLPGKVLLELAGKTMLQHVFERVTQSTASQIVIATDDQRVAQVAEQLGAEVCMTAIEHQSGTERLAEVVEQYAWAEDDIVVNVQADEPLMPPALIDQVANDLAMHDMADVATLSAPVHNIEDVLNPNSVSVVTDKAGFAMYFSRASLPWYRDGFSLAQPELPQDFDYHRHIGIYAYKAGYIKHYNELEASRYEHLEALEQLRILWHGGRIHVAKACEKPGLEVNTPDDFDIVNKLLADNLA